MNEEQKNQNNSKENRPKWIGPNFEQYTDAKLDRYIRELKVMCNELDPYGEIDPQTKSKLQKLGVIDHSDPFQITNQLIFHLENALEQKESRKDCSTTKSEKIQ